MEKIIIHGNQRLEGQIRVNGMKNSALPILYSCILVSGDCIIDNVPRVSDVENTLAILRSMGARAEFCASHTVIVNTDNLIPQVSSPGLISSLRASSYLLGALLSRFGYVCIPFPGGCNFGSRPLDLHLKGFELLGATCEEKDGFITVKANKKLNCNKITLDKISVGATINMVLASVHIDGETVIENAAKEPHVDDLICFLNNCGAKIARKGNCIFSYGAKSLFGTEYKIFSDMIEALTYITAVGICKGEVEILYSDCPHIENELNLFRKMGFDIKTFDRGLFVKADKISGADVETAPYPMFPTDLHPQFASLLCFSQFGGTIKEGVFPSRFAYVNELKKLGANIDLKGDTVSIKPSQLNGAVIDATDLRAGAALILASLGSTGESTINNVKYIVRGYESIVDKLASIGGKIKLIKGD